MSVHSTDTILTIKKRLIDCGNIKTNNPGKVKHNKVTTTQRKTHSLINLEIGKLIIFFNSYRVKPFEDVFNAMNTIYEDHAGAPSLKHSQVIGKIKDVYVAVFS